MGNQPSPPIAVPVDVLCDLADDLNAYDEPSLTHVALLIDEGTLRVFVGPGAAGPWSHFADADLDGHVAADPRLDA